MHFLLKKSTSIFLIFFTVLLSLQSLSQNRNAAIDIQNQARTHYYQQDFRRAIIFAVKAISKDTTFSEPYILLANLYQDKNDLRAAMVAYQKGLELDSVSFPNAFLTLARLELDAERFSLAIKHARQFIANTKVSSNAKKKAQLIIASAEFRQQAFMHPVDIQKNKLRYISDHSDEYINGISLDGKKLLFTKKINTSANSEVWQSYSEQIYEAELIGDSLHHISVFELSPEMQERVGAASLSTDGRYLFFTSCHQPQGGSNCDLYCMSLQSDKKNIFNLGRNINSQEWESQPCFSADGKTMFFASKREGGFGGSDIWISRLNADGSFARPKNAGAEVNTADDEMAPFIHADTRSLYFSSKGHPGMGGFDLFVSKKDENGQWTKAENLGYPLNTSEDEINLIIAPDGVNAYLSVKGDDFDIYHFMMKQNEPSPVTFIRGIVTDAVSSVALFARIELIHLSTAESYAMAQSYAHNGHFRIPLPLNESFAFHVNKEGYLFYSENVEVNDFASINDTLRIALQPIRLNAKVALNNVLFETDKFDLLPQSEVELNVLINFLENNPKLTIEIGGHTDNVGRPEYNQTLSENRAKAVYDYLIEKGIVTDRLLFNGYGETEAVALNETEEGRAINRRTEFKIVGLTE